MDEKVENPTSTTNLQTIIHQSKATRGTRRTGKEKTAEVITLPLANKQPLA